MFKQSQYHGRFLSNKSNEIFWFVGQNFNRFIDKNVCLEVSLTLKSYINLEYVTKVYRTNKRNKKVVDIDIKVGLVKSYKHKKGFRLTIIILIKRKYGQKESFLTSLL